MNATSERDRQHEPDGPAEERDGERIEAPGPIHLAACLGVGGLVALAISAIEWFV
jgi:hypothetical protein